MNDSPTEREDAVITTAEDFHPQEDYLHQLHEQKIAKIVGRKRAELAPFTTITDHDTADRFFREQALKELDYERDRLRAYADSLNPELHNKLGFHDRLVYCITEAMKKNGIVTLIRADMDNFKLVNQRLGHDGADQLLIDLGSILIKHARRRSDIIGRIETDTVLDPTQPLLNTKPDQPTAAREGGDEFGVILPVHLVGAKTVATRVQKEFRALLTNPKYAALAGINPGITIGMTSTDISEQLVNQTPQELAQILKEQADDALFVGKNIRKGGIFIYDPREPEIIARQAQRTT